MTFLIIKVMGALMQLRAQPKSEGLGMDVTQHGEEAYASAEGSILVLPESEHQPATAQAMAPQVAR
jgi:Amt family ammonium transporter